MASLVFINDYDVLLVSSRTVMMMMMLAACGVLSVGPTVFRGKFCQIP